MVTDHNPHQLLHTQINFNLLIKLTLVSNDSLFSPRFVLHSYGNCKISAASHAQTSLNYMKQLMFILGLLFGMHSASLACTAGIALKVDRVTLNSPGGAVTGATTINFRQIYSTPPLVFILPSDDNPDPTTVRILNVTTTSFTVGSAESEGEDGVTTAENFHYIAIEPGNYNVGGTQIQAGTITTTQLQSGLGGSTGYANINFAPAFPGATTPIVIHEIQSFANDPTYNFSSTALTQPWLETIGLQASFSNTGGQVALERAETSAGTVSNNETIAYLAISAGTGSFIDNNTNTINYNAFQTADNITGNCVNNAHGLASSNVIAVGSQARRDGGNGGWLRLCSTTATNLSMTIEEDRANDSEQDHTTESATIIAFSQAFDESGGSSPTWEAGSATVNTQNAGGSLLFTNVSFPNAFASTPLVFTLPTTQGTPPASVRIRNVSTTGFSLAQVQPQGEAGAHPQMTVDYLAIVPGTHAFPNGNTQLEAGSINTSAFQGINPGSSSTTLNFVNSYTTPALLLDIQSTNSEPLLNPSNPSVPWLETAILSGTLGASSASIALEMAQTSNGTVLSETIAYLVAESNQSQTITANGGSNITIKTLTTADNLVGYDNSCVNTNFTGGAFGGVPFTLATQATRDGSDGGWVRRCNISAAQIGLLIDEDRALDSERAHTTERASVFAFSNAFEWCAPSYNVTKGTYPQRDPANDLSNPKSIPGALQRYAITVDNQSRVPADNDSIRIDDEVPIGIAVFVQSSTNYPEAPFVFTDGAGPQASALTFNYGGPADLTDDVEFSSNNGADSYLHVPTPDADGFANTITNIRIRPKGAFSLYDGSNVPTFTIEFGIRVQ